MTSIIHIRLPQSNIPRTCRYTFHFLFLSSSSTLGYNVLSRHLQFCMFYITLHYTILHYTTLHYTTPLHITSVSLDICAAMALIVLWRNRMAYFRILSPTDTPLQNRPIFVKCVRSAHVFVEQYPTLLFYVNSNVDQSYVLFLISLSFVLRGVMMIFLHLNNKSATQTTFTIKIIMSFFKSSR